MTHGTCYVGIDVAKADFVVASRPQQESWTMRNDANGIKGAVARLREFAPALIVLESTGGYEVPLADALTAAGLPIVIVNPRQVRDFGKATGQLAKTDTLDAQLLALFAERVQPSPRPRASAVRQQLAALAARRRQLHEMRTAEMNRSGYASSAIRTEIRSHLRSLDRRIATIDRQVNAAVAQDDTARRQSSTRPGIGPIVSAALLAGNSGNLIDDK